MKRMKLMLGLLGTAILVVAFQTRIRAVVGAAVSAAQQRKTTAGRLAEFGDKARQRMKPAFAQAGVAYPPKQVYLVGIKEENILQVFAPEPDGGFHLVTTYRVLAASGEAGPKLREGDGQVPEGIYPIESLNPNSQFHVSLRVGYPNDFDRQQARREGRHNLGGDIMIHGNAVSIGCLAMGDTVAEELFTLAADTGVRSLTVVLTPVDFRRGKSVPPRVKLPSWTPALYDQIKAELRKLPLPPAHQPGGTK
jgi:murein L,D-transpeptidase YafK